MLKPDGRYQNQKRITIHKAKVFRVKAEVIKNFAVRSLEEETWACKNLSKSELNLWMYFSRNKDGHTLDASPKAVKDSIGLSKNCYHAAMKGLEEKGCLVKTSGTCEDENFDFYLMPFSA